MPDRPGDSVSTIPSIQSAAAMLREFLRLEAAGGLLLMAATVLAMVVANSPLAAAYESALALPFEIRAGTFSIEKPMILWINDGLMAVFFLLVGLELKREVLEGHLSSPRKAMLPLFAAAGGMGVPAVIYIFFNQGDAVALKGWALASSTDIAFALGILSLLGRRVPPALKAFLLSVAIFDDLGAIVVIAMFYTAKLSVTSLVIAGVAMLGLAILNRMGVTRRAGYFLIGIVLWVAVLKSGVHATLAGVILAMFIPLRPQPEKDATTGPDDRPDSVEPERVQIPSPLLELEHALHPWVAFGVLPVFAFANAGIPLGGISLEALMQPLPVGIAVGLVMGNLVGVTGMAGLAVLLRVASLPQGVRWSEMVGVALLCGVGFTMSLFVASLAFEEGGLAYPGTERLGILIGSLIAGVAGYLTLRFVLQRRGAVMGEGD